MPKTEDRPCLFCQWKEDLRKAQTFFGKKAKELTIKDMSQLFPDGNKPWKSQFMTANEHFFAVLCIEPKIEGHTLIISREHFSSMADSALAMADEEFKIAFFDIMTEMARKLAVLTKEKELPKVYFMSMCEHWKKEELDVADKSYHTEHLHFHLLPRHKAMRTSYPYFHPESMFTRCDKEARSQELEETRRKILDAVFDLEKNC